MVQTKEQRAVVEERDYAVAAKVRRTDANGEELPRSDRFLIACQIREKAVRSCGYPVQVVEDAGDYAALVELGDASDQDFEEVGGALVEASTW